ncbi:MAG TPA: glycosyltransferase [Longimicrobiales bacterium]
MTPADPAATVLIFRKRLLPWSETFIAAQGRALRRWRPVFVGYAADPAGITYLDGCERLLLSESGLVPGLGKALFRLTGRLPGSFLRALGRTHPRLVHAHFGTGITPAGAIAGALRVPLIVTFHGHDIATAPRSTRDAERRARGFASIDRAIAVSDFIAARLRAASCPPAKIVVHRIGVDTDRFSPPPAPVPGANVLFVGRLVPKKGLAHLLRAFPAVQSRVSGATLTIVGDGPLRVPLEALARDLGMRPTFTGVRTPAQILEHMRSAALLAAPSIVTDSGDAEGLPITIMEASACGLPVVASPSGGSAEGVRDGVTGFLVPPGDEETLGRRIADLLEDASLRARMGAAARALALSEFSLAKQTEELERIYDEVSLGSAVRAR